MDNFMEKPFTIDGVKSWIHCINLHTDTSYNDAVVHYHYHDYIEFLYAIDAEAYVWIGGECYKFNTGDLVVINSNEMHTLTFLRDCNYICVKFSPQILYSEEQSLFEIKYVLPFLLNNSQQKVFKKDEIENVDIYSLAMEIMKEWESRDTAYELLIRADILKIFTGILRYWRKNNIKTSEIQVTDVIKKAFSYILENYDSVKERDVAEVCGLSYNHFSVVFKKATGQNFNDYITALRIREAEKLLLSTDNSITDIAISVGFSSASHFISRFKKYKKMTPKQFKSYVMHQ